MYNFFGPKKWRTPIDIVNIYDLESQKEVTIKRERLQFFYLGQKTTVGALRKIYTDYAITALEKDGYISIKHD